MSIRQVIIAAAAVAAFSPVLATASPEQTSMDACARALATSISAPTYKLTNQTHYEGRMLADYPAEYTFVMEAHNTKTGAAIAKVRCSTDEKGTVTSISAVTQY
jgi:hypothetical protein